MDPNVENNPILLQTCPDCGTSLHLPCKERVSVNERIKQAMQVLHMNRLSLITALVVVLDPSQQDFAIHRDEIYKSGKLHQLLDNIFNDPRGSSSLLAWMEPHSIEHVSKKVYSELDSIKDDVQLKIDSIMPEFFASWDIDSTVGAAMVNHAPTLSRLLLSACQTTRTGKENIVKNSNIPCQVIVTQLANVRSDCSLYFAVPFTLFLWTNGASRQTIEALARCGLCISFTSLTNLLHDLAPRCVDRAIWISRRPHVLCYDGINISTSIFVEQQSNALARIQSGTFPIIYEITNANPEHMRLAPMLLRAEQATGLRFNYDIRPTFKQMEAFGGQLRIHVVKILLDGDSAFYNYPHRSDSLLQHKPRRKLSAGIKTKQFPLRTSTIDESSVSGNIAVINDVYINQLKMTHEELSDMAIPSINDQSTNARIRDAKVLRTKDVNPFTRLQCFQLGLGLFHLSMNLIWALLHVHRGSIREPGSLSYFFVVLDPAGLDCEHPNYHTLLATLMQILRGVILNAWKAECGYTTLAAFSLSNPTPKQLCDIANRILCNHATPPLDPSSKTPHTVPIDNMNRNLRILTRDLLVVFELTHAISDGDFGRVEDMLGYLTMILHGAGSNNYCTEILHFIFNLKCIWTPEFADIMRDNMLVNLTGLEGHFMAIDLNMEHLTRFLKRFFAAEGVYGSWDRLGDISATVGLLQHVRERVGSSLGTPYHGLTQITPDTDTSVEKIIYKVNEFAMHVVMPSRNTNTPIKPVIDALAAGEQKLRSSTLAAFNRKVQGLLAGAGVEAEEDEIPPASFDFTDDLPVGAEY